MSKFNPTDLTATTKPTVALELQPKAIAVIRRALTSWAEGHAGSQDENEAAAMLARSIFNGCFAIEVRTLTP